MDASSLRNSGKEVFGKLYRGSVVDAYNRLSQPSIPSKSEKILQPVSTKEGFGCSASRFYNKNIRIPGPGHYNESINENPSVSKKGYGGLTNSAPRFKRFQYVNSIPGPGAYDQVLSPVSQGYTISIGKTKSLKKKSESPAPGQYDPGLPSTSKEATSMFKSKSKRLEVPNKVSPAPWQYTPNYSLTRSSSTALISAFKMPVNVRRYQINLYDPHSSVPAGVAPGPGDYNITEKNEQNRPSSMFASSENDRFGKPVKPKVIDNNPGPGSYVPISEVQKAMVTGAVFMSESERKWIMPAKKPPGPAFYKPMYQPKKKSFHLKPNDLWV